MLGSPAPGTDPLGPRLPRADPSPDDGLAALLPDLLHDWLLLAEYDGGYALHRCRLCGTEVVR